MRPTREVLCEARDAAIELRDHERRAEAKRELCVMRARGEGPSARGGATDPTRRIDDLVDFEAKWEAEHAAMVRAVERAKDMLADWRAIDCVGARVLWLRYIEADPWDEVARKARVGRRRAEEIADVAIDRIDSEGLNVRSRKAKVTGAEDAYESDWRD